MAARATPKLERLPVQRLLDRRGLRIDAIELAPQQLDPFVLVNEFRMSEPAFPAHPHAGFSAVTYLFDDGETDLVSRDSLGNDERIRPGDLHWMLAGSGVVHEEVPAQRGRTAHGLQLFVNLPCSHRQSPPRSFHLPRERMPRIDGEGWSAVVPFGSALGVAAPLPLPVRASLAVIDLQAGASLTLQAPADEAAFALVIKGEGRAASAALRAGDAWRPLGALDVQAASAMRIAVLSGVPLREPVVRHGPFVMGNEREVVDAMRRYQQGDMGRLPQAPAQAESAR